MKQAPHLIISVDYEVFGNGSGCLISCVKEPADRLMYVAEKFSAPVTFFVEALEFEVMQKNNTKGIDAITTQLITAYGQGHDVQLHVHPQWHGAERKGESWVINKRLWRMGDLNEKLAHSLLKQGKLWLESFMTNSFSEYRCIAFRAGGWCIQPSELVIMAMIDLGFKVDSTVAPNLRNVSNGEWVDFRSAPKKPFWKTNHHVCCASESGIWEVPIVTAKINLVKHLMSVWAARSNGMAKGCFGSYEGVNSKLESMKGKIAKVSDLGNVMLDISTMPTDILIEITEQWLGRFKGCNKSLPLVAIAHTKNFTYASERNMLGYLEWVESKGIKMSTYGGWMESLKK